MQRQIRVSVAATHPSRHVGLQKGLNSPATGVGTALRADIKVLRAQMPQPQEKPLRACERPKVSLPWTFEVGRGTYVLSAELMLHRKLLGEKDACSLMKPINKVLESRP